MTRLSFTYHEIMDTDFTAITVTIRTPGKRALRFANFDPQQVQEEMYANQTEKFVAPTHEMALGFVRSNGRFRAF